MKRIEHPMEIKSCISANAANITKTLSLEQYIACVTEESGTDPLKVFEPYSVFKLTLIEKQSDIPRYVYANIPVKHLRTIEKRTEFCTGKIMEAGLSEQCSILSENLPSAYTVTLSIGSFRGKTPAEVLKEEKNLSSLENTAKWLKDRLNTHKNNKIQYEAVMEAINLFREGKLNTDSLHQKRTPSYVVYGPGIRTQTRTTRKDGKNLVHDVKITCFPERTYPYEISIVNYWAKCNGIKPLEGTISDRTVVTMNITEYDWDDAIEQMRTVKSIFTQCYGKYELNRATEAFFNQRAMGKSS